MRALKSVEGIDKLGPTYLIARERVAERMNTLRMGLILVFMEVTFICIIRHQDYYRRLKLTGSDAIA
jgi:hypothetical protein